MTTDDNSYTPQRELRDLADYSDLNGHTYTAGRLRAFADHIDELEKKLAATRELLDAATYAWDVVNMNG